MIAYGHAAAKTELSCFQSRERRVITKHNPKKRLTIGFGAVALPLCSALTVLLLITPILTLAVRALIEQSWQKIPAGLVIAAVGLSLSTTVVTALLTIILGTPLAFVLARKRFWGRRWLIVAVEWPIVLPPAVAGLALLITFGRRGLLGGVLDAVGVEAQQVDQEGPERDSDGQDDAPLDGDAHGCDPVTFSGSDRTTPG